MKRRPRTVGAGPKKKKRPDYSKRTLFYGAADEPWPADEPPLIVHKPLIFTAQSKYYFYCRDGVCEFVLKQGGVPINPFRMFGYFLDDRVERNIIRQANNNMIRSAQALWVFGDQIADGVLAEIFYAQKLGKLMQFFTISDRAEDIKPISIDDLNFEMCVLEVEGPAEGIIARIKAGEAGRKKRHRENVRAAEKRDKERKRRRL